jgi:integrase
LRVYPIFEARPVGQITALDVQAWVTKLSRSGLAAGTVHNAYRVLSGVLDAAVRANYTRANVARSLTRNDLPKPVNKEMLFLTAEEVHRVAEELPEPWGLMVRFAAVTGMRAGEVNGLRWENVDLLRGRVRVAESVSRVGTDVYIVPPKNGKVRTVPLSKDVAGKLRAYAEIHPAFSPEAYVWPSPMGLPDEPMHWGRDFYLKEWKAAVARADLPKGLRFHDLRHTCAALLIVRRVALDATWGSIRRIAKPLWLLGFGFRVGPLDYVVVIDTPSDLR